jgi:branched-chain amino acid transport system substrate-binding protein
VRTRTSRLAAAVTILALVALVVAAGSGCGGEVTESSTTSTTIHVVTTEAETTTTSETPTTEQLDSQTIRIGAPLPLTGIYAADGQDMQSGLEMAVADLSDAGGLLGRPVELRVFDTEDLTAETLAASKDYLLGQIKADVIIEGYGGYGPDFEAFGAGSDVPFIHASGSAAAADLVKSDPQKYANMFQVSPVEAEYGKRAFEGVTQFQDKYQYPNKKIAIFYGDQDWDKQYASGVAAAAQAAGWQIVMNDQVTYDTTDWAPVLAKIRAEQPAAIVCSFLSVDGITSFVDEFMKAPTPSLLDISYLVTLADAQDALGDKLKGVMGYVSAYVPPSTENDAWKKRYKDSYGVDVPLTNPPSAYDSVMLWAEAVKAVGDPTKYEEIAAYIKSHPYKGLLGTYDFNNAEQTVKSGPDFAIAYAQYKGDGKLAFYGTDKFTLPAYMQPAWLGVGETTTTATQ